MKLPDPLVSDRQTKPFQGLTVKKWVLCITRCVFRYKIWFLRILFGDDKWRTMGFCWHIYSDVRENTQYSCHIKLDAERTRDGLNPAFTHWQLCQYCMTLLDWITTPTSLSAVSRREIFNICVIRIRPYIRRSVRYSILPWFIKLFLLREIQIDRKFTQYILKYLWLQLNKIQFY
jgi:hypothetical protein